MGPSAVDSFYGLVLVILQTYNEISEDPVEQEFSSVLTPSELADNQKLQTLDMQYYRVPLQYDTTPTEQVSSLRP